MNDKQQVIQQLIRENCIQEAKTQSHILCQEQPDNADAWFTMGLINAQSGNLDEAAPNFQQVLTIQPQNAEAYFNLGKIFKLQGRLDNAIEYYGLAIKYKPDFAEAYINLGNSLIDKKDFDAAMMYLHKAININPEYTKAYVILADLMNSRGLQKEAMELARQAIKSNPKTAALHFMLGDLLYDNSQFETAIEQYWKSIQLKPDMTNAYYKLGNTYCQLKRFKEATKCYLTLLKHNPGSADIYNNLGIALSEQGKYTESLEYYNQSILHNPKYTIAYNNLGNSFLALGQHESAQNQYQKALQLDPNFVAAHNNLGAIFKDQGLIEKAIKYHQRAAILDPEIAGTHNNLGNALREAGQYDAALRCYQQALALQPGYAQAHSNLLLLLSYNVLRTPQEMLEESQHWDHIQGKDGKAHLFSLPTNGNLDRRLRIGYVSPDMRHHAVSYFLEPILAEHDRAQVEVFCYAEVNQPDTVTQRLKALADHWRSTVGMTDQALAQLIFDDHIDILIDLTGHTANNRLKAFTYKPAPVQATYLGYFATTGLATMDYWITDETLHPQDTVELATESLFRLPRCCLVYQAAPEAPEVIAHSGENIVFGSFNQMTKTSPATIALWAKILQAVPQARLLIKTKQLADPAMSSALRSRFAEHGIDSQRLILLPYVASEQAHLETYGRVDIALDTIPRTGGSTTAEALWMGVPVITLAGERFIERLSASMLNAVGLDELIAESQDDYVARAVALANDRHRLSVMRASLRERLAASPLCNAKGLAQSLESAYRDMWKNYLTMSERFN